jgi:hypothetical protein
MVNAEKENVDIHPSYCINLLLNNFYLILLVNNQDSLVRQISDGTVSSNDSSSAPINSPLPFKKRAWTSSNVQDLIEPPSYTKV